MPAILLTPPAVEPVSLADAKTHLRVGHADEDNLIAQLIAAARRQVEAQTGLKLISQQWTVFRDDWPEAGIIDLPLHPVLAVDELSVFGDDDEKAVVDPAHYYVDAASRPARLRLRGARVWARPGRIANGIAITATAGFGADGDSVPEPLRQAILVLVAHWFEHRGAAGMPRPPLMVDDLLRPFREVRL